MKRFFGQLANAIRAILTFIITTVSALVVLALGVVLLLVALVAVTDRSDRVTTTDTVASQTEQAAPTAAAGGISEDAAATETDSQTTVTTTADAVPSDAVIVAALVAGLALVLLGLLWGRVTSVEVGPSGLKLAIQAIQKKRDEATQAPQTTPAQANSAAVAAVERLLGMAGEPSPVRAADATGTDADSWWRRQFPRGFDFGSRLPPSPATQLDMVAASLDAGAAATVAELLFDDELTRLQGQQQQPPTGPGGPVTGD